MPSLTHSIPTRNQALALLENAARRNPGPWVQHSLNVAQAAERIAAAHPHLDPDTAYILGCLHDIGRREGVTDLRHVLDGYQYLTALGYADAARICLTHSFAVQDLRSFSGQWDCNEEQLAVLRRDLAAVVYDDYDRLIQLCDALGSAEGFWLIEKRIVDVALRHGLNDFSVRKWQAVLDLEKAFSAAVGQSVYALLPGVVETTFGFKKG